MTQIWDPYRILNITTRGSNMMHCVGHTQRFEGSRCRWKMPREVLIEVHSILDEMQDKSPNEASQFLPQLANLCLCKDYHANQYRKMIDEWTDAINYFVKGYEKIETLEVRCKALSDLVTELRAQIAESRASASQEESDNSQAEKTRKLFSEYVIQQTDKFNQLCQTYEKYKIDTAAIMANQSETNQNLESDLSEADRTLTQLRKDHQELTAREAASMKEAEELRSQLATECQKSEQLHRNWNISSKSSAVAEARLSSERQKLEALNILLSQAQANQETLTNETESLRSQLATECQNSQDLHHQFKRAMAEEAALREQLSCERQIIDRLKKSLDAAESNEVTLSEAAKQFRLELETEHRKAERVDGELVKANAGNLALTAQLSHAQQGLEQLKQALRKAETKEATLCKESENLRLQVAAERQNSELLRKTIDELSKGQSVLHRGEETLRSQLATERQNSERLGGELSRAKEENSALAAQVSSSQQDSEHLKRTLLKADTERAALLAETEALQLQVTTEQQSAAKLHDELRAAQTQFEEEKADAAAQMQLEGQKAAAAAQDATSSASKLNDQLLAAQTQLEEQKAAAAARDATSSAERARMLAKIAELERSSSSPPAPSGSFGGWLTRRVKSGGGAGCGCMGRRMDGDADGGERPRPVRVEKAHVQISAQEDAGNM